MEDTKSETCASRLSRLSTLGLTQRMSSAVLYCSRFSVWGTGAQPSCMEITSAQAFVLSLYRSFLIGDAPAVYGLLPLVPELPQLQSSSIAVWFREDFVFKRQDVTRALSWMSHFIKREGPVIPLNILLVFSSLEEKYQVFSHFKEVGDTVGQEMLIYLNPYISKATQARLQDVKDQSVTARPQMVSKGTQTSMAIRPEIIRSIPLTDSNSKDHPVLYAAYQNIESILTETILEEPQDFNESHTTRSSLPHQREGLLTFLVETEVAQPSYQLYQPQTLEVRSRVKEGGRTSERPRSLQPNEVLLGADSRPPPYYIPDVVVRSPERRRSSERPRSLQPNEIYSLEEAHRYANIAKIRPSSSIEAITIEKERKHNTFFRRSNSTLEGKTKNSTLSRNITAAAKAEATKKLMKAAERGDVDAAAAAIAEGANVDHRDSTRRTPLHLAVVGGHEELLRRLLAAGADRHRKDSLGRTPLHYTALRGRVGCALLLLEAGADPNLRDSSGLTPTALASMKRHSGVAAVLKKKGGQDCSIS